jgi:hypothetical protein
MSKYLNIIPTAFLFTLFIFLLEGIIFYTFLYPFAQKSIANVMQNIGESNKPLVNNFKNSINKNYSLTIEYINTFVANISKTGKGYEQDKLEKDNRNSIIVYSLSSGSLFVGLVIFYVVCRFYIKRSASWGKILFSILLAFLLISVFIVMYFFYVSPNLKFNTKQVLLYVIEFISKNTNASKDSNIADIGAAYILQNIVI